MTTPESPDNSVLVMDPPWVLLATQPVVDADVGLPLASYDLIPDGEGAMAVVDPPLAGTVELDDVIWLWLVGDATFLSSAFITDVNAKTSLRIPKGRLYSDQINKLFYTITRGSSNVGKSEPNLTLLYNKIRPALKDRFPEIDGHSELELRLADDIKNGVGPDFVSAQVWVSYPYCRAYDTITLKCNGEIMTYQVRPDEAPQPPNPGSADPIAVCFTVTRAYLQSAVRPGGKLHFSCTCTDQIGNTPDTDAVWSATQTVDEDLAGLLLPAALLREQLNDPGDDLSLIDLEKLRGNPLLLVILTADSRFQVGYTVNAVYTATLTGQADVVVRVSGTVEADEFGQKKTCVLEVPNDKVLAGRTVTVMYELFDGATLVGRSKTATALVVGENTIEIDAPRLLAPATIPVDALDHEQGVNVRVDFAEAQPGDKAQLVLRNPLPGSPQFPELSLDQTFAIFTLDVVFLGLWHGKAPELSWDLIRGGKVIAQSLPLVLTVLPISNEDDRLPTPKILQAANNGDGPELDVSNLTPGATVRCLVWPLIAFGQPVWLHLRGKNAIGGEHNITLLRHPTNAVHQAWLNAGYYDVSVLYSYLKDLGDGSDLELWFTAALDKGTDESKAVRFSVRRYTVKALVDEKPNITSVKGSPSGVEIPNGDTTVETSVTLTGTASKGQKVQVLDGATDKGEATADPVTGIWEKEVRGLSVAVHSFTAVALYGSNQPSTARSLTVAREVSGHHRWIGVQPQNFAVGVPKTFDSGLTVTAIRNNIYGGYYTSVQRLSNEDAYMLVVCFSHTRFTFNGAARSVSFKYSGLKGSDRVALRLRAMDDSIVHSVFLPAAYDHASRLFSHQLPGHFVTMEIEGLKAEDIPSDKGFGIYDIIWGGI
ncbi:hypothetical protein [Pseudomonas arsenicoxydans]|uniref:hypothetical protein n=1 Tax=Pseudomonas arsenicoxydans TaxID=702115 RepID=UPI001476F183|nr:hypothetical protein [Pseudomonas arsenicoxydans]